MSSQEEKNQGIRSVRISKRQCNHQDHQEPKAKPQSGLLSLLTLPVEVLLEILSYLRSQDFYALREVSEYFHRLEPLVWKIYEVEKHDTPTSEVIQQLKRMPLLEQISIDTRSDCDEILRQLSLTNKRLQKLKIINCTGSTSQLYLRSCHLTRILERCRRLHTINIIGSRFRGIKFYRLLGDMGIRLRSIISPATCSQFRAFVKHASHLNEDDRATMYTLCIGGKTWSTLHYFMTAQPTNHISKRRIQSQQHTASDEGKVKTGKNTRPIVAIPSKSATATASASRMPNYDLYSQDKNFHRVDGIG